MNQSFMLDGRDIKKGDIEYEVLLKPLNLSLLTILVFANDSDHAEEYAWGLINFTDIDQNVGIVAHAC